MKSISREYYYNYGNCYIEVDEEYISIEFFPYNQSKESFESAEYSNTYKIESIEKITNYELVKPKEVTYEEVQEIFNLVKEAIKEVKGGK